MSENGAMLPHRAAPARKSCPKERLDEAFFFLSRQNREMS